jgi:hypothetical protein
MPNIDPACTAAFRQRILEPMRAGYTPAERAREFEPRASPCIPAGRLSIQRWRSS